MADINLDDPSIIKRNLRKDGGIPDQGQDHKALFEKWEQDNVHKKMVATPQQPVLKLSVSDCADLIAADVNGSSDPYLVVIFDQQRQQTQHIKKNLHPKFNFETEFRIELNKFIEITVEVWDHDIIGSDDFLGLVHLNVAQLLNGHTRFHKRLKLQSNKLFGQEQGDISIKLKCSTPLPIVPANRFNGRKQNMFDFELTPAEEQALLVPTAATDLKRLSNAVQKTAKAFDALRALCVVSNQYTTIAPELVVAAPASASITRSDSGIQHLWKEFKKPIRSPSGSLKKEKTKKEKEKERFSWDVVLSDNGKVRQAIIMLDFLPEEVLVYIFRWLTDFERSSSMRVCKEWHRILSDSSLKSVMAAAVEQFFTVKNTKNATESDIVDAASSILKLTHHALDVVINNQEMTAAIPAQASLAGRPWLAISVFRELFLAAKLSRRILQWVIAIDRTNANFPSMINWFQTQLPTIYPLLDPTTPYLDKLKAGGTPNHFALAVGFFQQHTRTSTASIRTAVENALIGAPHVHKVLVSAVDSIYKDLKASKFTTVSEMKAAVHFLSDSIIALGELSLLPNLNDLVKQVGKYGHAIPVADLHVLASMACVQKTGNYKRLLFLLSQVKSILATE